MKCLLCNKDTSLVIANKLRCKEKRKVYYCKECELGMLDDIQSEEYLKSFYNNSYRKKFKPKLNEVSTPKELFDIYSDFQDDRVRIMKKYLTKKMRLLEIGCSAGMFLFHIKGYVKEVVGIDYDSKSALFASKKCSCKVFDANIEETNLEDKMFDVICMFQVLEHIKNPIKFLVNLKKYLKPNGVIYIEVPNLHDALIYAYDLPNHKEFYFHIAHLWYFNEKSINILMSKAGFNGQIDFIQDYNVLNHMHWISVDAPQKNCLLGLSLPKFCLRENLGSYKKGELNDFIQRTNIEYNKLLVRLKITSNISFIGRKRRDYRGIIVGNTTKK